MDWTEETISRLRSLWQEGLSTAEIGRRLSITKNAVVGKAHRLTLPPRPSPIRKPAEGKSADPETTRTRREVLRPTRTPVAASDRVSPFTPRATAPVPVPAPVAAAITPLRPSPPPAPQPIESRPLVEPRRRGQSCCWPLGEPGTKQFRFCGAEPLQGKPYCTEHAQLAYVRLRDRRDTVA